MLRIIHRDERLVAIDKPSGLLVHRSDVDRHACRFAVQMLRDQIGRRVHPVHRLDRATSGVLLFALDREGASTLARQFEGGLKRSRYLAIVRGHTTDSGVIDKALAEPEDPRLSSPIRPYRPAFTHFTTLARTELPFAVDRYPTSRDSLLMIEPETGRRQQIRRHLKHLSHPIVGDTTYGKGRHNRFVADHFGVRRLLLACIELTVAHPDDGRLLTLVAPPGDAFGALLAQLGWADVLAARWHGGNEPQAGARGLESDHLRRKMEDCEESPGTPR